MENNLRFINLRINLYTSEMRSILAITLQDGEDKSAEYKSTVHNKSSLHVKIKIMMMVVVVMVFISMLAQYWACNNDLISDVNYLRYYLF